MSGTTNTVIDLDNARITELKGLIANHECRLGIDDDCFCERWTWELEHQV